MFYRKQFFLTNLYSKYKFIIFIHSDTHTDIPSRRKAFLTKTRFKRMSDIHVFNTWIRDMAVVTQDRQLVCYNRVCNVTLISTNTSEILSELYLRGEPWSVCLVGSDRAALTLSGIGKVQLLKIEGNKLVKYKLLKMMNGVYGITASGDNLVLTNSRNPWIRVISWEGKILKEFNESQHFDRPDFITTSPDGILWIADWRKNTITKMDASLTILQTFTSPLLETPLGITAVTEDQVLVCSHDNHNIMMLQPSTDTMSILLGTEDGIIEPFSLTYCPTKKNIYFAQYRPVGIHVFQIATCEP